VSARTPIPSVNSTTYGRLSGWKQRQIDEVAAILLTSTGAYHGSETDARTDATTIVLAMQFSPAHRSHTTMGSEFQRLMDENQRLRASLGKLARIGLAIRAAGPWSKRDAWPEFFDAVDEADALGRR
jgi:hypothetical protein